MIGNIADNITIVILLSIIAALLGLFVWREYCHDRERRDLYSRLMAGNLAEYQALVGAAGEKRSPPSAARNFVRAGLDRSVKNSIERDYQEAGE